MRRPRFRGYEIGYRGDYLEASRADRARYWRLGAKRYASGVAKFAVGGLSAAVGLAAAGLSNLSRSVPVLDTSPDMGRLSSGMISGYTRKRKATSRGYVAESAPVAGGDDRAGYTQFTVIKRKQGRPPTRTSRLLKTVGAYAQTCISRFQNLQSMDSTSGQNYMTYAPGVNDTTRSVYPVYLFDLTSSTNQVSATSTGTTWHVPAVQYRLSRSCSATTTEQKNTYSFLPDSNCAQGKLPDTTTAYTWCWEKKPSAQAVPLGATHFDWFDIQLMLWGARTRNTRFNIQLVQFPEEYCPAYYAKAVNSNVAAEITNFFGPGDGLAGNPYFYAQEDDPGQAAGSRVGNIVSRTDNDATQWDEYWAGYVDDLVTNPMNKRDAYNLSSKKPLRILMNQTVDINPYSTTEGDTRAHMKLVKIFKRINRVINYQHERTSPLYADTIVAGKVTGISPLTEDNPNRWDAEGYDFAVGSSAGPRCFSAPKKASRVFLLIKASCPKAGAFDADKHASFDFMIRRKQTIVPTLN